MDKLGGIASLLNTWGQAETVRASLSSRPRSQNGMPSRPVVGTAVTIKLDVSQTVIDEWLGGVSDQS